ncbi:hypothetical protein ASPZODRAFT_329732 [Penicilliopsis zonata CBS 506.65]|uniref:RING-type domain-containing protein n=1 Tax=Penicilliopsis zonata CBS 506.65 TaxID=1073090 RepID=A0A1L9SVQ2_9EURO|nr:hypothetical protein ASPZODRAFT_329732 [Penicilliopsis zonata CBS 506.65]OJJ51167.1 hypothetical protein ASPZODRAFT_329732 [Penicilliopsis zonata CBS 506.65]
MESGNGYEEPVDLRALDYVSSYDDHLMCPICRCPFIRPVRLQCDHVFCQKCLNTAMTTGLEVFTCPTCRAPPQDVFQNVPRILTNMCDEIRVRCPFVSEGCQEIVPRGHVQSHVDKYCGYKPIECPSPLCNKKIRRKDLPSDDRCLHELHVCSLCEAEITEQDYDEHVNELCPYLKMTCPDCLATMFRNALKEHIDVCPEAIHPCAASKYGCPVKIKRAALITHEKQCPLLMMSPYFEAQNSRLESLELKISHLQQRNEIFEEGLAKLQSTLMESPQTNNSSSDASDNQQPRDDRFSYQSNANTYLLSLHESLREEVARMSQAITDLDARASMTIMNECLRIKEDMAHTNAAVGSVRMQVQWLMNPRLHHGQRVASVRASGTGSSEQGSSNAVAPSPGLPSSGTVRARRLSDSGREGTKL